MVSLGSQVRPARLHVPTTGVTLDELTPLRLTRGPLFGPSPCWFEQSDTESVDDADFEVGSVARLVAKKPL